MLLDLSEVVSKYTNNNNKNNVHVTFKQNNILNEFRILLNFEGNRD